MTTRRCSWRWYGPIALALLCGACEGTIGDAGPTAEGAPAPGSGNGSPSAVSGSSWPVAYNGTPSSLRRLTRDELVVTMQQVTGGAPARADLPPVARTGNGPLLTGGVAYAGTELPKLQLVVNDFAGKVAGAMLAKSGCRESAQAQRDCLQKWSQAFAASALRRPMRDAETTLYKNLFATADGTSDADVAAMQAFLNAVFFSPSFLYRTEIGTTDPARPGVRALGGNEIATRLSYLATLGPPDPALLAAAAAGTLGDGKVRSEHLARLLKTDPGKHALSVLVLEWLGANEPILHLKSAKYLAGLAPDFEASVRASAETAISKALLSNGDAPLANLLTTASYLGDPAVVAVTQAAGSGSTATGDTADTGRTGILMHPQVVAAHTKDDGLSPFRVGRFLREDLLCEPVAPPPASASAMALPDLPAGATLRENYQHRISAGQVCLGCHTQFAPLGYALLPFDPVGRWLKQDPSGRPWDLSGSILTYSGRLTFAAPADLMKKFAASPQVHGCFAQAALQWTLGRNLIKEDEPLVRAVDDVVKKTNGDVVLVLQGIVAAPEFTTAISAR